MYYSYSEYLKEKYGQKVYKLPVNLPVSCPNRKEGAGCSFCADEGTGFEAADSMETVNGQLKSSRENGLLCILCMVLVEFATVATL